MSEFSTLLIIGIALSLDALALALSIGTITMKSNKYLIISLFVGLFHFFMPLLGLLFGSKIMAIFHLRGDFLLSIILFYIAFEMIHNIINKEEIIWDMKIFGIISFAFTVSIDSFSIGLGLNIITSRILLASLIFSFCSAIFTYLGLILGRYTKKKLGSLANLIGAILLLILGLIHLL